MARDWDCLTIFVGRLVVRLLLLHGAVVVHKHKGAVIVGVGVALRALVSGTQVTFGIVGWESGLGGTFLRSSSNC